MRKTGFGTSCLPGLDQSELSQSLVTFFQSPNSCSGFYFGYYLAGGKLYEV